MNPREGRQHLAIIGHPIGHALSPLLHSTAFATLGMDWTYEAIDVPSESLRTSLQSFRSAGLLGFNVTIPHKEAIIPLLDSIDEKAAAIGAVNTVSMINGKWCGTNTDVLGVLATLKPFESLIRDSNVLILGAGGAARSCAYAVGKMIQARTVNFATRTASKAERILEQMGLRGSVLDDSELAGNVATCTLIINTTPLGMHPKTDDSPLNPTLLLKHHLVFDTIYRPFKTKLLKDAESAGATTLGGLEMLVQQGAAAFHLWTGKEMPLEPVRAALLQKLTTD